MFTENYIPNTFRIFSIRIPRPSMHLCIRDNAKNMELTSNRQLTRCHSHADVRKRIQLMKCRSNGR